MTLRSRLVFTCFDAFGYGTTPPSGGVTFQRLLFRCPKEEEEEGAGHHADDWKQI